MTGKQAAPVTSGPIIPPPSAALTATPIEQDNLWIRLPKPGQTLRALTRSYLYQLCAKGTIRSITIRAPHNKRGCRLLFLPSLDAWLASLDREQNGTPELSLLCILDNCTALYAKDETWGWATAEALAKQLCDDTQCGTFAAEARKIFSFQGACGSYLRKLGEQYPERFKRRHTSRGTVWLIRRSTPGRDLDMTAGREAGQQ